jgi:hypothetical protein
MTPTRIHVSIIVETLEGPNVAGSCSGTPYKGVSLARLIADALESARFDLDDEFARIKREEEQRATDKEAATLRAERAPLAICSCGVGAMGALESFKSYHSGPGHTFTVRT